MATETELKFRILPARLPALRRAVATRSAAVQPLAAAYFDTPGEHLARARWMTEQGYRELTRPRH